MITDHVSLLRKLAGLTVVLAVLFLWMGVRRATGADSGKSNQGQELYKANCTICHGEDGTPTPIGKRLQAPDLTSREVQSQPNAALERIMKDGKNNMPPFGDRLDSQQIKSLVTHVRRLAVNTGAAKK